MGRLTDKFRSPVVLCDLEGQSLEQAAASLRCPVGTVKSRLSRARQKLRSRLLRRGLSPSVGFLAATLAPEPAGALPADLVASTIDAATHLAAGRAVSAGVVSATVAALLNDTLRSMSMNALKLVAVILTASGIVATSAGVLAFQTPRAAPDEAAVAPQRKPAPGEKAINEPVVKRYMSKEEFKAELTSESRAGARSQGQSIASLAKARLQAAEKIAGTVTEAVPQGESHVGVARVHAVTGSRGPGGPSLSRARRRPTGSRLLKTISRFMKELEEPRRRHVERSRTSPKYQPPGGRALAGTGQGRQGAEHPRLGFRRATRLRARHASRLRSRRSARHRPAVPGAPGQARRAGPDELPQSDPARRRAQVHPAGHGRTQRRADPDLRRSRQSRR